MTSIRRLVAICDLYSLSQLGWAQQPCTNVGVISLMGNALRSVFYIFLWNHHSSFNYTVCQERTNCWIKDSFGNHFDPENLSKCNCFLHKLPSTLCVGRRTQRFKRLFVSFHLVPNFTHLWLDTSCWTLSRKPLSLSSSHLHFNIWHTPYEWKQLGEKSQSNQSEIR